MENWQIIFVNLSIFGFIFQLLLIVTVYQITKHSPLEKSNREILEKLYKIDNFSINPNKNTKF